MASELKDLLNRIGKETVKIIEDDITSKGLIRTGALLNSIAYKVIMNGKGEYRLTFHQIFYGFFLDKGTRKIDAREFFQRHIDDQLDKYASDIAEAAVNDELADL